MTADTAFRAIIWDCDGVLIDSEHIACGLSARLLTEAGYPISTEDFVLRFAGQSKTHIFDAIKQDSGVDYAPVMAAINKKELQREAFRRDLKAIAGIAEVLDGIDLPMAIASGSDRERLEFTLQLTGLYDRFLPHIYDAAQVAQGKPAPDLFLFAAEKLHAVPADCLVVGDSLNGVRAGKAAGMTVFGFTGGSHVADKAAHERLLLDLGADLVFRDMQDLPHLIRQPDLEQKTA